MERIWHPAVSNIYRALPQHLRNFLILTTIWCVGSKFYIQQNLTWIVDVLCRVAFKCSYWIFQSRKNNYNTQRCQTLAQHIGTSLIMTTICCVGRSKFYIQNNLTRIVNVLCRVGVFALKCSDLIFHGVKNIIPSGGKRWQSISTAF